MKKFRLSIILFLAVMFGSILNATTVYEEGNSTNWVIYDNNPSSADVKSVTDTTKGSVIEFSGNGIKNGYRLGNSFGEDGAWNDTQEFSLSWSMNFSDSYVMYVRVQTESGYRYLYYTKSNKNIGRTGRYIHHGIGENDGWQEIIRDLQADLQDYEPYNNITSVNAFLVRGDGKIDDIKTFVTPNKSWLNYDAYELYEDAQNGDYSGWTIYDNNPLDAIIKNVFDEDKSSKVIEFKGDSYRNGIRNGYRLGNDFGKDGAWNNEKTFNINWSMKFDSEYYIFVSVQTDLGHRYLYYTNSNNSLGKVYNYYIHHGLGESTGWKDITRDLQADLKEYEPENNIISVNAFLVRGNGRIDNIFLFSKDKDTIEIVENIDISVADVSIVEGDAGTVELNFDVVLSENALDDSIVLDYNVTSGTADNDDYNSSTSSNKLYIGSGKTQGTITLLVYGDKEVEGNETISVTVIPENSDIFNQEQVVATGTIINDDYPNTLPVANDQNVTLNEDTNVTITLTGSDVENSTLTFSVQSNPSNGTLSGEIPNLVYTPNVDFAGSDSFTFIANDGELNSSVATVNIVVTDVPEINNAPVANDQNVTLNEDTNVTITLTGSDVENSTLTFSVQSNPSNGILSGEIPNLVYTPNADFAGNDSLTFIVNDGELNSSVATVNIGVTNVNDEPVVYDQNITGNENSSTVIELSAEDNDNDNLTYTIISFTPESANLVLDGSRVTYTPEPPPAIFNSEPVSFTYKVNDGIADSNSATVIINFGDNESDNNETDNNTTRNFTISGIGQVSILENYIYTSARPILNGEEPIGTVIYTLGGDDAGNFDINASSGVMSMVARDYENPVDANTNNVYNLTITATDEAGNFATKSLSVSISDVEDSDISQNSINPIADYRFDESSWNGTTAEVVDSSGNNLNGTVIGGASITAGKAGNSGLFDGIDDYIDMGDVLSPGETDKSTISIWFKSNTSTSSSTEVLFSKEAIYMAVVKNGYFQYAMQPHWYFDGESSFPVTADEWIHAVITYDGENQKLYKNGVLVYQRAQTGNIGSNNQPFSIGAFTTATEGHTSNSHFKGNIDEVKVFDVALTSDQVQDLYNSQK